MEEAEIIECGRVAWSTKRNDADWAGWVKIGHALEVGKAQTMRLLGMPNQQKGHHWSKAFGAWLQKNELDGIDKGMRSRLGTCMEHLTEIEAWRATIGLTKRLEWNNPNTVWRHWQAACHAPEKTEQAPAGNRKDVEIARLQEELDAANAKIRRLERAEGDMLLISRKDSAEDILRVLESEVPAKAGRIAGLLMNRQKSTAAVRPRKSAA